MNRISAIVPAYANQNVLDRCICALLKNDEPIEIIVVDDGSPVPIVVPENISIHRIERDPGWLNCANARNEGALESSGEFLLFIDSNKICQINTPSKLLMNMMDMEAACGVEFMVTARNKFMDVKTHGIVLDHGSGCLMRRSSFFELGGYDAKNFITWGFEGYDFSLRWMRTNRKIYTPDDVITEYVPDSSNHRDMEESERQFMNKWGQPREYILDETYRIMN